MSNNPLNPLCPLTTLIKHKQLSSTLSPIPHRPPHGHGQPSTVLTTEQSSAPWYKIFNPLFQDCFRKLLERSRTKQTKSTWYFEHMIIACLPQPNKCFVFCLGNCIAHPTGYHSSLCGRSCLKGSGMGLHKRPFCGDHMQKSPNLPDQSHLSLHQADPQTRAACKQLLPGFQNSFKAVHLLPPDLPGLHFLKLVQDSLFLKPEEPKSLEGSCLCID